MAWLAGEALALASLLLQRCFSALFHCGLVFHELRANPILYYSGMIQPEGQDEFSRGMLL